jgi:hypothetical protein
MVANRSAVATAVESAATPQARGNRVLLRGVATVGLQAIALIHLLDLPSKLEETPYQGWLFIALIGASLVLAWMLTIRDDIRVWLAAGGLAAAVMVGYVISRSVGLPAAPDDIGNWIEPLGLASLFAEGTVVLAAFAALRRS